ncbi:MAG TPA: DUF5777 family beta-barrel protein [Edaphocola sp.]|nr:DUF5777 family beta-barrel protein [Edaphocola sp.]
MRFNFKITIIFFSLVLSPLINFSQNQNSQNWSNDQREDYTAAFQALQIGTTISSKLPEKNSWNVLITHRFGDVRGGFKEFFGLDNASTRLGVVYGLTDFLALGISRETQNKTFEFNGKYRILKQSHQFPVEIVALHTIGLSTEYSAINYPGIQFLDRLSYLHQLLFARRFNENISLQISGSFIHKNLYDPAIEMSNQFYLGLGGKYKLTRVLSLTGEYFANLNSFGIYNNPLTLGLDVKTGRHVFQLLFSNSQINSGIGYLSNAVGDWSKGKVFFGFNLYRTF